MEKKKKPTLTLGDLGKAGDIGEAIKILTTEGRAYGGFGEDSRGKNATERLASITEKVDPNSPLGGGECPFIHAYIHSTPHIHTHTRALAHTHARATRWAPFNAPPQIFDL